MPTKPAGAPPRRYFTMKDFEKGLCDKNGIATKPEAVQAQEEADEQPSPEVQTPVQEEATPSEEGNDTSASDPSEESQEKETE